MNGLTKEQIDKLLVQSREAWIRNIMKVYDISYEEAEKQFIKINPKK
jgi:hypothetical protein